MNSLVVWFLGLSGITAVLGINIAVQFSAAWLCPRIVWGGLWGLIFLIPLFADSPVKRGVVYSIAPILVQLFIVFPFKQGKGIMGLDLGSLTPLLVICANLVWGIVTSYWLGWIERRTKILFVPSNMLLAMAIKGGSRSRH